MNRDHELSEMGVEKLYFTVPGCGNVKSWEGSLLLPYFLLRVIYLANQSSSLCRNLIWQLLCISRYGISVLCIQAKVLICMDSTVYK